MTPTIHRTCPTARSGESLDLAAGAEHFRRLGWPSSVDSHRQRLIVLTGDVLDALILPAQLGKDVAAALSMNLLSGPISTDSGHRWWTFVTAPCPRATVDLPAALKTARVHAVPRGGYMVVPHPADIEHWPQLPKQDQPLPPWSAVTALARTVLEKRH